MRTAQDPARCTVVGVYPSAWHVTWTAPAYLSEGRRDRTGGVRALAVDVEPTVFWNGEAGTFAVEVAAWRERTVFIEGDERGAHGHIAPSPPAANGSSGKKVEELYLSPLGVAATEAAFTDIYPAFVVKYGSGNRREQGDAIRQEYDSIAGKLRMPPSSIPERPGSSRLPALAVEVFADRIVGDLEAADAPVVVSLGEEAFQALRLLRQLDASTPPTTAGKPAESLTDLYDNGYGARGVLRINDRSVEWLPMAHPGLLKGRPSPDVLLDRTRRTGAGWNKLHARWARLTAEGE